MRRKLPTVTHVKEGSAVKTMTLDYLHASQLRKCSEAENLDCEG